MASSRFQRSDARAGFPRTDLSGELPRPELGADGGVSPLAGAPRGVRRGAAARRRPARAAHHPCYCALRKIKRLRAPTR